MAKTTKVIEETQEKLYQTLISYTRLYCQALSDKKERPLHEEEDKEYLRKHVQTLATAVLAINGIDTYEMNNEG